MLEKLALKHDTWVKYARQICKDAYLADDLVSEMYLRLMNCDKEVNDWYVYFTIKHRYIDWISKENSFTELSDNFVTYEENERITIELPDTISWVEKQILILRQSMSCREIEKQYKIHYLVIHRTEKKAKEKLKDWAKEKYKELEM